MKGQEPALIEELQKVAAENVPKEDYQQQVDRWNRYQTLLGKVEQQCQLQNFRFSRNINSSYRERRILNVKRGAAIGFIAMAAMFIYSGLTMSAVDVSIETVKGIIGQGGIVGLGAAVILLISEVGKLPETIKFECKPKMFIDDLYYIQRFVHGFAREQHDPEVKLPALTMELPQAWIKQQSLLTAMDSMKGI